MSRCLQLLFLFALVGIVNAEEIERTYHLQGLFDRDRIPEFRDALTNLPPVKVKSIDYASAEVTLQITVLEILNKKRFKEEQLLKNLSQRIRSASKGNFDIQPRKQLSIQEAEHIRIPLIGHDCRGCSFGAYRAVYKEPGVIRATCALREGHVKVWIDPKITNRKKLEAAMTKKKIKLPEN